MATEKSSPKRSKFLYRLTLCAGLLCSGGILYLVHKQSELLDLVKQYRLNMNSEDLGMCSGEVHKIREWCKENYEPLSWKNGLLRILPINFDYFCGIGKPDLHYYQQSIQQFLIQVDEDENFRKSLEEKVYSSENEIAIDVHKNSRGRFELFSYNDPSDPVYDEYLANIRNDQQLQQVLWNIFGGKENMIPVFMERAAQLVNDFIPLEILHQRVLEGIEERLLSKEMYEELEIAASEGKEILSFLARYESLIEQHDLNELWEQSYDRLINDLWEHLRTELVRDRFLQVVLKDGIFPPSMLAFGHTHPYFYTQEEEGGKYGPSEADIQHGNASAKPEFVFTSLPDRWQIYVIICGESDLVREYRRTL